MTSEKKRLANQRNSKRSSGPRTEVGKRRVAINAVRHGLANLLRYPEAMPFEVNAITKWMVEDPNCPETPEEARIWAEIAYKRRRLREARAKVFRDLGCPGTPGRGKRLVEAVKELDALERYDATSRRHQRRHCTARAGARTVE